MSAVDTAAISVSAPDTAVARSVVASSDAAAASAVRIDFHFGVDNRLGYACRVVRKARAANKTLLVYSRNGERLAAFDQALWNFSALDFLPHVYCDSPLAALTPILLCAEASAAPAADVLLLLDDEPAPEFAAVFPRYQRVIEIVSTEDADRHSARARFKAYRAAGLQPNSIERSAHE